MEAVRPIDAGIVECYITSRNVEAIHVVAWRYMTLHAYITTVLYLIDLCSMSQ